MSNQYPPPDGPGQEPDDQHGSDRPPPPPPPATGPQWNPQSGGTPPPGSGGAPGYGQPGYGQPDQGQPDYGQSPYGQSSYGPAPSYQPQGAGHPGGYAGPPKTSPLAIVSLVLGVVGFVFCTWFVLSLAAAVTGFIARRQIKASQGTLKGAGMATSGLVLGVVSVVLGLLIWVLISSGTLDPADLQTT